MKKVVKILVAFSFVVAVGFVIAYYNTSALGYDDANIISFGVEDVRVFDYDIKYKDIKKTVEKAKSVICIDFMSI